MQLKKGEIIEFTVDSLVFGGKAIGEFEGLKVFVNKAIPGDRVSASLTKIKKNYAEAQFVELLEPSKDRVKARCQHAGTCGGCTFQQLPYEKQLEAKKQFVVDAFERIGGLQNPPVRDVIACEDQFYYRNKMEFSFGYDAEMKFAMGMHLPGRRYDILDLKECHLQSEGTEELLSKVREFVTKRKWKPFKYSCGQGFLRSLFVREGKRTGELMIVLSTSDDVPKDLDAGLEELSEILGDKVTSFYWSQVISKRGSPKQIKETLIRGRKTLKEDMILENGNKLGFEIAPQAFFQPNTFQAEKLYTEVIKLVEGGEFAFDLFCGTGTIGLFMAKHVGHVLGIELNESAVQVARENAQKNAIFNIDFFVGDVGKLVGTLKERPSVIVVDPPRAGLNEKTIAKISEFDCERIIYVSCNPSTLARDCQWLAEFGYKVESVQPVDMFPHTYHIENVCLLKR